MNETRDELNTSEDGQLITFGSPQLGIGRDMQNSNIN